MIANRCEQARLWMQAPEDLNRRDRELLTEHLDGCPMCRSFQAQQARTDMLLRSYLAQVEPGSVRHRVRAGIEGRGVGREPRLRLWLRAVPVAIPLALLVAILALGLPQMLSQGTRPTPARAAWRLVRPEIGYPVAVDPSRQGHLLAGAWGQVYESINAGKSWRQLAALPGGLVIRALSFDVSRSRHFLVATKHSIFLSVDAGRSWQAVATDLPGAFNVFLLQDARTGVFYVGPSVLWKSTDHGRSWERAGQNVFAPYGIQGLFPAPNGRLMTGIWGGGVALSHNEGRTWERFHGMDPHVLDVAAPPDGSLWAATPTGLYMSRNGGSRWGHESAVPSFFATTLLWARGVLLAGGNGALYATYDAGKTWTPAMDGLPLDPWIYQLSADPGRPGRIYASLNGDGLFRSDDYGRRWAAIDVGLPLRGQEGSRRFVLFTRQGYLWITDTTGADPGVLTVERNIRLAALSPDGAAVAYLTAEGSRWAVRMLGAGGSATRTVASGTGPAPEGLLWSPNSAVLAVVARHAIEVAGVGAQRTRWELGAGQRVVGWSPDGRGLLLWQESSHRLTLRAWSTGAPLGQAGFYPGAPVFSRDGKEVAFSVDRHLWIGRTGRAMRRLAATGNPVIEGWSDDGSRVLVRIGSSIEIREARGRRVATANLADPVEWLPGSNQNLLTGNGGALCVWSVHGSRAIVSGARPIESMRGPVSP